MPLDVNKRFAEIRDQYKQSAEHNTFTALIYGDLGTGKTTCLRTARLPILLDCFDPGGAKSLSKEIAEGKVLPRNFGNDDRKNPTSYRDWERQFLKDKEEGFFNHVGTYCIDSLTTFVPAVMNYIVNKHGSKRPDFIPAIQDYLVAAMTLVDIMKVVSKFNCDFIVTGHIELDKDEVTGQMLTNLKAFKSLRVDIPILFDEKYVSLVKQTPSGPVYEFLTQPEGRYTASTRLGNGGKLAAREPQDIKAILKKVGYPTEDKPLFL